jgi:hypothetical protein
LVRAPLALPLTLAGCEAPFVPPLEGDAPAVTWEARDLWRGEVAEGAQVTVSPLVVASPRDLDGGAFFAADPDGGPRSGVRIVLGLVVDDWPLPVGTPLSATGTLVQQEPPVLWVASGADLDALEGEIEAPVATDLDGVDDRAFQNLRFALVVARDQTVTSTPDPLGHADATEVLVGGRFGVSPGYGRTGDLTGILGEDLRVSARTVEDWTGELHSDPPLEGAVLSKLDGIPAGTPLVLQDVVMATPWSRDLRWAVLQDADGVGAWVDAEGWGLWGRVAQGSLGRWTVEVRYDEQGVYLRTWLPPRQRGTGPILVGKERDDGALVWFGASEVGPPDAYGLREAGDLLLDDRFLDLSALAEGDAVAGVGAVRGGVVAPVVAEIR